MDATRQADQLDKQDTQAPSLGTPMSGGANYYQPVGAGAEPEPVAPPAPATPTPAATPPATPTPAVTSSTPSMATPSEPSMPPTSPAAAAPPPLSIADHPTSSQSTPSVLPDTPSAQTPEPTMPAEPALPSLDPIKPMAAATPGKASALSMGSVATEPTIKPEMQNSPPAPSPESPAVANRVVNPDISRPMPPASPSPAQPKPDMVDQMKQANKPTGGLPKWVVPMVAVVLVLVAAGAGGWWWLNRTPQTRSLPAQNTTSTNTKPEATVMPQLPQEAIAADFVDTNDPSKVVTVQEKDEFNLYQQAHPATQTMAINGVLDKVTFKGSVYASVDETTQQTYIYAMTEGLFPLDENLMFWIFDENGNVLVKQKMQVVDTETTRQEFVAAFLPAGTSFTRVGITQETSGDANSPTGQVVYAN